MNKLAALALATLIGTPLTATAIPVTYKIKFTTLTGSVTTETYPDPLGPPTVHVANAMGNVYFGLFGVDDSILLTDGLNKPGIVDFFHIQMEDNIWAYNVAGNNSFVGFRGPGGIFAPSPGFDVVGGMLTNLRGGVFGVFDEPFVDFSLASPNTFNALGRPDIAPGTSSRYVGADGIGIQGTMEIFRVPEPAGLPLLGIGLLILAWTRRTLRGCRRGD